MARPKKIIEIPGESAVAIQDIDLTAALQVKQADIASASQGVGMGEPATPSPPNTITSPRPAPNDLTAATADEITALFAWYGFVDTTGQSITTCLDFQQLTAMATAPAPQLPQVYPQPAMVAAAEPQPTAIKRNSPVLTEHGWLVK